MKLEIWCKSHGGKLSVKERRIQGFVARTVEWPVVPRIGEFLTVWDGFGQETVLTVNHDFDEGICVIEIGPDYSGEYRLRAQDLEKP